MSLPSVLVVEDEEAFIDALTIGLEREGFEVRIARDGAEAIAAFDEREPDLILLDLMLPRISGIDVCRDIRTKSRVPIIMVTAKSSEIDVVVGLEVGADDYITKPYRMRELIARMRAVMRRSDDVRDDADRTPDEVLEVGDVRMDRASHEVFVRDEKVALPLKEYELLSLLLENAGRVLARDTLIDRAWGHDYVGDTKTLDVHIKRLRGKIEDNPSQPVRIVTVRGVGYKFERTAP
ncbi:MAG: response regulator transcription factor [Acidimicrobiales bacterium]